MIQKVIRSGLVLLTVLITSFSEEVTPGIQQNAPDSTTVTLLFAGDIMQHGPQIDAAWNKTDSTYNYEPCFRYIKSTVSAADFAIANLEVTLAGKPYTGYPQFSAPDALAAAARDAGFDVLATANNHCCDRGKAGLLRTTRVLDSLSILRTGTFRDSSDFHMHHPLILRKHNITIALLNYTYGTNGLPVYEPTMVNRIDSSLIAAEIKNARQQGADFVIVFMHWGIEYQSHPNKDQQQLAALCHKSGADVVIGSHPHVLQPLEYRQKNDSLQADQLTVYSLGNYVSNQRDRFKDGGAMVQFTLSKSWNQKQVLYPAYHLTWVYTPYEEGKKQYYILPVTTFENDTTIDASSLEKLREFAADSRKLLFSGNNPVPEYKPFSR